MNKTFLTQHKYYVDRVNSVLEYYLSQLPNSILKDAMSYSLQAGGKRIRPLLVYVVGEMFGCSLDKLDAPAAAIEMIHTYSLIHDDLPAMDNDDLRRGQPTCHIKFSEDIAILAGDALQTLAFQVISTTEHLSATKQVAMIKELSLACGASGMCLGQILDLEAEHRVITHKQLNQIHQYKTGALIKSAIRLGMIASNDTAKNYQTQLDNYADAIGLAFQIQDDILDVTGDQNIMGKAQGSDIELAKSTYPALLGLDQAIEINLQLYQQAIEQLHKIHYNSDLLRQLADFIIQRDN